LSRGLPAPVAQLRVETARGTFFSDLGWTLRELDGAGSVRRSVTVHAEFDGRVKYLGATGEHGAKAVVAEKLREDALREKGDAIRRFVTEDLRAEETTFARLCSAFPPAFVQGLRPVGALLPGPTR
jgi:hypothetical protein